MGAVPALLDAVVVHPLEKKPAPPDLTLSAPRPAAPPGLPSDELWPDSEMSDAEQEAEEELKLYLPPPPPAARTRLPFPRTTNVPPPPPLFPEFALVTLAWPTRAYSVMPLPVDMF
jgi:hypothetical protein